MTASTEVTHTAADILLDGQVLTVKEHGKDLVYTQPGDRGEEFERRIENWGLGWGSTRYEQPGTYDYGLPANLHSAGAFLPGAAVVEPNMGATPTGSISFGEYWDGTDANRRLIIVAARHVFEVAPAGTITATSLTGIVAASAAMGRPVRFRAPSMAAPKIYIPVKGTAASDDFIVRSAANTYAKNTGSLRATAMAAGKDIDGEDVMFRVDEDGRLNLTTADTDPNLLASWAGADYGIGETSTLATDLHMQNRAMLVGKEDGAWTFDQRLNVVPVTPGIMQTPDADNFKYIKDANGQAVAPTAQGLVWIDGLDWGVCGPVSSNPKARNLRGLEQSVSAQIGNYIYTSVYFNSNSYIFAGTPRLQGDLGGNGPFTWHGPVAVVTGRQITDLFASTVVGSRLWWGAIGIFGYINLNSDDFSPALDSASGHIYLPEGILDIDGPATIKDFRKVEFITRAGAPFGSANQWTFGIETTPSSGTYVNVDGGYTTTGDGVVASRFFTTETSGKRLRSRISYQNNAGAAELEAIIVRGTQRQERTWLHTFTVTARHGQRNRRGANTFKTPRDIAEHIAGLERLGRKVAITYGDETLTGYVENVSEVLVSKGVFRTAERTIQFKFREVTLS